MMVIALKDRITHGERIRHLAEEHPDRTAVVSVAADGSRTVLNWAELERTSNRAARGLLERGLKPGSPLALAVPPGIGHVVATAAAWKTGALVVPLNHAAAPAEREQLRETVGGFVIGDGDWADVPPAWWETDGHLDDSPVQEGPEPRSASASGGSTGRPRIVVRRRTWTYDSDALLSDADRETGLDFGQTQLVMLPMYHAGFTGLHHGLVLDHTIVLMERFVPRLFGELVEEFRVNCFRIVPTMMRLILQDPGIERRDLSSVVAVHQGAGACPESVKHAWLKIFRPEACFEDYSSVERLGLVTIRGDEWLRHPGSVGRPTDCEVRIVRPDGTPADPGEVGEIYLRSPTTRQPEYLGDGPQLRARGDFLTLGDLGRIDDEGYLYLVGRTADVINVGGANVYPAEIEAVLLEFPGVRDAAVIGRPHDYLGQSVHAVLALADPDDPPATWDLDGHCRRRLSLAKVPMSYEFTDDLGRTEAGKLRHRDLARTQK
ncbi:class I adenylate-forming enzyme family protein [Streptomyces sp. NPDC049687]|uniref:class I adenylate-forming enzyme family protein n=1 Tax=Streptomyces sp. NPDC049687 TaxID=3365596 RepID=UPI0037873931